MYPRTSAKLDRRKINVLSLPRSMIFCGSYPKKKKVTGNVDNLTTHVAAIRICMGMLVRALGCSFNAKLCQGCHEMQKILQNRHLPHHRQKGRTIAPDRWRRNFAGLSCAVSFWLQLAGPGPAPNGLGCMPPATTNALAHQTCQPTGHDGTTSLGLMYTREVYKV